MNLITQILMNQLDKNLKAYFDEGFCYKNRKNEGQVNKDYFRQERNLSGNSIVHDSYHIYTVQG